MKQVNIDVLSIAGFNVSFRFVDVVGTTNLTNYIGTVVNGVTVTANTRILLTAQTSAVNNGIWKNNERTVDFMTGYSPYSLVIYDVNTKYIWLCTAAATDVIDTNNVNFIKLGTANLGDVSISAPTNGQALVYNGSVWANSTIASGVSSFNSRTGAVVPAEADYTLNLLGDVTITSPTNGQVLGYNGSQWVNTTSGAAGVSSFNSRTGAVVPVDGDYSLNLLGDVAVASPATYQILNYNGTQWVNTGTMRPTTLNLQSGVIVDRNGSSGSANMALMNNGSSGQAIWGSYPFTSLSGLTISSPVLYHMLYYNGTTWVNTATVRPLTLNMQSGGIVDKTGNTGSANMTLLNNGTSGQANWGFYPIGSLSGVAITTPAANQILTYNGSQWVNTGTMRPTTLNLQSGVLYDSSGNAGSAGNVLLNTGSGSTSWGSYGFNNLSGVVITSPADGDYLEYNGTNWVNVDHGGENPYGECDYNGSYAISLSTGGYTTIAPSGTFSSNSANISFTTWTFVSPFGMQWNTKNNNPAVVEYHITTRINSTSAIYNFQVYVNSTGVANSRQSFRSSSTNNYVNVSGSSITNLNAGDVVTIRASTTVENATLTVLNISFCARTLKNY